MSLAAVVDELDSGETGSFYPEQVRQLYSLLPVGLVATAVNSAIVAAVLSPVLPDQSLVIWFGALLVVTSVRVVVMRRFNRTDEHRKKHRYWGRLLIADRPIIWAPRLWSVEHERKGASVARGPRDFARRTDRDNRELAYPGEGPRPD